MTEQFVSTPLWAHQVEGLAHLDGKPRAICAWDMGTGKTMFGLERDQRFRAMYEGKTKSGTFKTLVVAPHATHKGWIRTIRNELGDDYPVCRLDRTSASTRQLFLNPPSGKSNREVPVGLSQTDSGIWLMHWDGLRIMKEELKAFGFHHLILDECHRIKNAKTKTAIAAKFLRNPIVTDMSGSPMTNKPQDLWSTLNHLYPKDKYWGSYWRFVFAYLDVDRSSGYIKIGGPKERWHEEGLPNIQPFFHRVELDDVHDMPKENVIYIDCEMEGEQRTLYDSMERDWLAWVDDNEIDDISPMTAPIVLAKLRRLQQFAIAAMYQDGYHRVRKVNRAGEATVTMEPTFRMKRPSCKVDALEQLIRDNDSEKFVVFSQFKEPFYLLKDALSKGRVKVECVLYTGDQDDDEREQAMEQFINGDARVICFTFQAGGEGIDGLQKVSRTIVFIDEDWTPEANRQALARLRRAGFAFNHINIIYLRSVGSVDDDRAFTIQMKRKNIRSMLGLLDE